MKNGSIFGFLFGMWILIILGGAILVILLGGFSLSGYGDFDYILTSYVKGGIAIFLVIVWIAILYVMKNFVFRKKFKFLN